METPYNITSPLQADPEQWKIGDLIFGTYRIVRKYTGGSSNVYGLEHSRVCERHPDELVIDGWRLLTATEPVLVAAKIPRRELRVSHEQRRMFENECRAWADLGHLPHVVEAYCVRYIGDAPVLVMEWVHGATMRELSEENRQENRTLEHVLTWTLDFCQGLKNALGRGLSAHGDITPTNLIVDSHKRLKVMDFGLAWMRGKAHAEGHRGTPNYRSPEQGLGMPIDWRSDMFSLASVMYEFIARTRPQCDETRRPSTMGGSEFCCLDDIWLKCLRAAPSDRFESLQEFEATLLTLFHTHIHRTYQPKLAHSTIPHSLQRARIQLELGAPEEALRALASEDTSDKVLLLRAQCLSLLDRNQEALTSLQQVSSDDPGRSYQRALALSRSGQIDPALSELDEALHRDPQLWLHRKLRVACLVEQAVQRADVIGRMESCRKAIDAADDVLNESGEAVEIWVNKGWAHLHLNQPDRAEASALRALELDPGFAAAHLLLGTAFVERGTRSRACDAADRDLESAILLLRNADQFFPDNPELLANLGNASLALRKFPEARYYYERSLRIDANCRSALNGRLQIAFHDWQRIGGVQLDYSRMAELGERLKTVAPEHPAALQTQANLLFFGATRRDHDAAIVPSPHVEIVRGGCESINHWRSANPNEILDLRGAVLRFASLKGADLHAADCRDADFRGCDLRDANLHGALLAGACLSGAFLDGANLELADLSYTEMQEATLRRANMRKANLTNANLIGFRIADKQGEAADITAADLTGVLLRQEHEGPMIGGFLELAKAKGLDKAIIGREVQSYLVAVLAYAKRNDIPEARDLKVLHAAVQNAEFALTRQTGV